MWSEDFFYIPVRSKRSYRFSIGISVTIAAILVNLTKYESYWQYVFEDQSLIRSAAIAYSCMVKNGRKKWWQQCELPHLFSLFEEIESSCQARLYTIRLRHSQRRHIFSHNWTVVTWMPAVQLRSVLLYITLVSRANL